jgi:transposase
MPESLEGFRYVAERFKALRPTPMPESLEGFRYVAERFKALRPTPMPESLEGFRYVAERFKALRSTPMPESLEGFRYVDDMRPSGGPPIAGSANLTADMYKLNEQKEAAKRALKQARAEGRLVIKVGVDAHLSALVTVVQRDEESPKAPVKFTAERLLNEVAQWRAERAEVFCCYEAGPLGFGLQRRLAAAGANCVVVRPRTLSEYGQRVKTDRRDAAMLQANLDRYLSGNDLALAPVAIPSEAEEQRRSLARERQHLARQRQRELQRFRGTCLAQGIVLNGTWYGRAHWPRNRERLNPTLLVQGERMMRRVAVLDEDLKLLAQQLAAELPAERPAGLGELSHALLEREIVQWDRFESRQQVASYTGMVPSEHSSGGSLQRGSITKHGHHALRHLLIEAAWRLLRFQPNYCRVLKWRTVFDDPKAGSGRRKKAIVALARQFAVDLWRWRTGRVSLAALGLKPAT